MTARAVMVGLCLLPLNAFWIVQMEMGSPGATRSSGPFPTTFSLFANVVLWLTALSGLNTLVRRIAPRRAFSSAEMLTVYVMLCIGTAIASVDFLDVLVPMMGHPKRFAAPQNQWERLILPHLPSSFIVTDSKALRGWYEGGATLYDAAVMRAWFPSVLLWSGFIFVLLGVMLCMATLVRRRWIERERLTFPVTLLPLALSDDEPTLWRSRLTWMGFGIAAGISLLNGLSLIYPIIPGIRVKYWDLSPSFTSRPSSAIGWTPIRTRLPAAAGLVVFDVVGLYGQSPRMSYVEEQCLGAYLAVTVTALWLMWRVRGNRSADILSAGCRQDACATNGAERLALLGLVVGFAFFCGSPIQRRKRISRPTVRCWEGI